MMHFVPFFICSIGSITVNDKFEPSISAFILILLISTKSGFYAGLVSILQIRFLLSAHQNVH